MTFLQPGREGAVEVIRLATAWSSTILKASVLAATPNGVKPAQSVPAGSNDSGAATSLHCAAARQADEFFGPARSVLRNRTDRGWVEDL